MQEWTTGLVATTFVAILLCWVEVEQMSAGRALQRAREEVRLEMAVRRLEARIDMGCTPAPAVRPRRRSREWLPTIRSK